MITFGFYGRSGQGVAKAVHLFAKACFMSGLYVQSFEFGHGRRGTPVIGFVKTDRMPIASRQIEEPDFSIVLDPAILDTKLLKENSILILNASQKPLSEVLRKKRVKIYSVDATDIALKTLKANVPNTAMLGAVTKLFNKVSMKSIRSVMEVEPLARENINALEEGYRNVK